ncbi:MAG TPA: hypothetical protein VHX66_03090 [Solirubrobacteraceae bacterium]|jgi:hypothetical protein|nr:hypothetical protein [Solirubrobacteraceae bacterium]
MVEGSLRFGLPLACALGAGEGAERLRRWYALAERSPPHAQRSNHQLELRWQLDDADASELADLVDAEREFCSFVSWGLSRVGTDNVLTVTADPARPEDLVAIATLFAAT